LQAESIEILSGGYDYVLAAIEQIGDGVRRI
jgi:hypothetical protein